MSDIRFRSTVEEAAKTALALSGAGSATELDWMPPTLAIPSILPEASVDNFSAPSDDDICSSINSISLDSDNLVAEDDLEDNEDVLHTDELIQKASAIIFWQLPVKFFQS